MDLDSESITPIIPGSLVSCMANWVWQIHVYVQLAVRYFKPKD